MSSSSKRERQLARERYERRQARRAQAAVRRRKMQQVLAVVAAVVLVIGGGIWVAVAGDNESTVVASEKGSDATPTSPAATAAESPSPSASETGAAGPCTFTEIGEPAKDAGGLPTYDEKTGTSPATATIATDQGDVVVELLTGQAPCTTTSFRYLAESGYFDGTACHRLTTQNLFVLQCGDPTGTGQGGPGYQFGEENLPAEAAGNYPAGTVAMANAGAGTNGSQFFLVYEDTTLPPNYTIFGTITEGLDVVKSVAEKGVEGGGSDGAPARPVTIESVQIGKA